MTERSETRQTDEDQSYLRNTRQGRDDPRAENEELVAQIRLIDSQRMNDGQIAIEWNANDRTGWDIDAQTFHCRE